MDPRIWGPYGWYFIHTACNQRSADKLALYNCLKSLGHVLPCAECRHHYTKMFAGTFPLKKFFGSGDNRLAKWSYAIHNTVNRRLGKPVLTTFPDYKKNIDHAALLSFIDIVIEGGFQLHKQLYMSLQEFQHFLMFVDCLPQVFPCKECRAKMRAIWDETFSYTDITNICELHEWYTRIRPRFSEACAAHKL